MIEVDWDCVLCSCDFSVRLPVDTNSFWQDGWWCPSGFAHLAAGLKELCLHCLHWKAKDLLRKDPAVLRHSSLTPYFYCAPEELK